MDQRKSCPTCKSEDIKIFIELLQMPVIITTLKTYDDAVNVNKGDIKLAFCRKCGNIFNTVFDIELVNYTEEYDNRLDFSPKFQKHNKELSKYLIDKYNLHEKKIIAIGCGRENFLKMLCDGGNNKGVGFDTACDDEQVENSTEQIKFVKDYFSEKYKDYDADFVYSRHVLEHLGDPLGFLNMIYNVFKDKKPVVLIEIPSGERMIKESKVWEIIYEHFSYFNKASLKYLFALAGFKIIDFREGFEGINLCIEAEIGEKKEIDHEDEVKEVENYVGIFSEKYKKGAEYWKNKFDELKDKKIVLWGAGARAVSFLNEIKGDYIKYAVDINPNKQGKFVAGTGQEIVSPEFLKEYKPDVVILMNLVYKDEIKKMLDDLGLSAEILCA